MRKFPFPRIHGPDHDLCIRSITSSFALQTKFLMFSFYSILPIQVFEFLLKFFYFFLSEKVQIVSAILFLIV